MKFYSKRIFPNILAISLVGIFFLLFHLGSTFIEIVEKASFWRSLLREGDYQKLNNEFVEIEKKGFSFDQLTLWLFKREIRKQYPVPDYRNVIKNDLIVVLV